MNVNFCKHYQGDGYPPTNQYCRSCENAQIACDELWRKVRELANSKQNERIPLINTNASISLFRTDPKRSNPKIVYLKVNSIWGLPQEDFLHFISTGHSQKGNEDERQKPFKSPSLTQQEPWVNSIVNMLGGWNIPEIEGVKKVQK